MKKLFAFMLSLGLVLGSASAALAKNDAKKDDKASVSVDQAKKDKKDHKEKAVHKGKKKKKSAQPF